MEARWSASRCLAPKKGDPSFYEASEDRICVGDGHLDVIRQGVFPNRKIREECVHSRIRQRFSGALGFDAKGARPGVSLVVGTPGRGRTTEGPDCEPLGKRTAASQSCPLERTPYFRFSQRGRRTARQYGLRRNARREDVVGDHDWARRNPLAVDRPESANSKSRKYPEVGEADSLV